jgi:hypothetical protein
MVGSALGMRSGGLLHTGPYQHSIDGVRELSFGGFTVLDYCGNSQRTRPRRDPRLTDPQRMSTIGRPCQSARYRPLSGLSEMSHEPLDGRVCENVHDFLRFCDPVQPPPRRARTWVREWFDALRSHSAGGHVRSLDSRGRR